MKKSVGLVIVTKFPSSEDPNHWMFGVLCQIRAEWNNEKNKPETYPRALQVACHGRLKEGEDFYDALIRESKEELGVTFTENCQRDIPLVEILRNIVDGEEVVTYGAFVPYDRLLTIERGPDCGGFDYVPAHEVEDIIKITSEMKHAGPPKGVRAMFLDKIRATKIALNDIAWPISLAEKVK